MKFRPERRHSTAVGESIYEGSRTSSPGSGPECNDIECAPPHWINHKEKRNRKTELLRGACHVDRSPKGDNEYLSISKRSKMMKYIIRLRKKRNFRKKMNSFFVKESSTITHLASNHNLTFEVILSKSKSLLDHFKEKCSKLYYTDIDTLNYIFRDTLKVNKEARNDAVAVVKLPKSVQPKEPIKFLLAFDRIRYAYNLGKILNTAASMGVDYLFYVHNTVDPFNHKVIEVTNGSHFQIPYLFGSYVELRQFCDSHKLLPVVAHTNGVNPVHILKETSEQGKGVCLILGNESTGPHADVLNFAKPISLPMHEMTNSLNVYVAASILIHYLKSMA
ncbi:RNA methyltransferase, putative [Plasmodium knowlesi strain H]|uniref:RNA methyltransferase, putative n=3 Tax=Plasmodium knowlesi TaxID=5850 RepID=A0A5K1UEP6_PLAKH|nr:RNA methyltransferase, putative [Plasmodium knowlesi strain H]OTN67149.1 putative RNA methyltransferase [Plasmodium knowlesi]CAA9988578.1 RNA methyltransferase, putative [Plasmodium knowlesi strain H]SBO21386.1 RNA methyltransferase, putative [Plasmodium knowlesi strain H]SBO21843.1 RNA methyltransferase, putative [Plasmodium knowlesi strain H]VVS78052.1 RNA methyltransferase, putative [Plasmodium knowlesi strain H]|eukprot:XP_002259554.1 rna methyltransferase, putative [Plasmodium knowlesi strain H]